MAGANVPSRMRNAPTGAPTGKCAAATVMKHAHISAYVARKKPVPATAHPLEIRDPVLVHLDPARFRFAR